MLNGNMTRLYNPTSQALPKHQQPCSKQIEMSELDTNPSPQEALHHCNMQEKLFTCQPSGMRAQKTGTVKKKGARREIQIASEAEMEPEGETEADSLYV